MTLHAPYVYDWRPFLRLRKESLAHSLVNVVLLQVYPLQFIADSSKNIVLRTFFSLLAIIFCREVNALIIVLMCCPIHPFKLSEMAAMDIYDFLK